VAIAGWGMVDPTGTRWAMVVDAAGRLRQEFGGGYVLGRKIINDGTWHHVAVVLDGPRSDDAVLYVDGYRETISEMISLSVNTQAGPNAAIGAHLDMNRYFNGLLDNVCIYDRALSHDEVWALATMGTTNLSCTDLSGDGVVDLVDLAKMAENWRRRFGPLVINEFMAVNGTTTPIDAPGELLDGNGEASDWIEIYNPTATPYDLKGWSLTDNAAAIDKWRFPAGWVLHPGQYLVVFASGKEQQDHAGNYPYVDGAGYLHTNFKLSGDGEYLALAQPDGTIAQQYVSYQKGNGDVGFPPQVENVSYGLYRYAERYFSVPTPGQANNGAFMGFAELNLSVKHGFFDEPFDFVLSTNAPGAAIRYSLNGSTPTEIGGGGLYTGPLTISKTTTLRAVAFKPGWVTSPVVTQTYIFVSDVVNQSPGGEAPGPGWPTYSVNGQVLDYGMDARITQSDVRYKDLVDDALLAIPSFSIVTDLDNLFNVSTGIYANPAGEGRAWERPASFELLHPDGTAGFQINGGLRIRGGFSRSKSNPKHAFRLFFRGEYGAAKLKYPLFGEEGADEFDCVDLRTSQNYSWAFQGDSRNTMVREVFHRDAQREMGQPYTRSRYYHLYVNGHYWGLYMTQERAEASFGESYFGGDKEDYDVIKHDGQRRVATDGNLIAYNRLFNYAMSGFDSNETYYRVLGRNADGTPNPNYDILVDQDSLIAYMLGIFYSGDGDAPISSFMNDSGLNNFYCMNNRVSGDGFKFFRHDGEHTLDMGRMSNGTQGLSVDRTGPWTSPNFTRAEYFNPQTLHEKLMSHPEYKMRFADLANKAFSNGGMFTPEGATKMLMSRAREIDLAIIAESARWGDSKQSYPFTKAHWQAAVNSIVNNYLPYRTERVINQLVADGWYPTVGAPTFYAGGESTTGGQVASSTTLSMTAGAGTIYYTTDGTDPRLPVRATSESLKVTLVREDAAKRVLVPTGPLQSGTGSILTEYWFGIEGSDLSALTSHPSYPDNPSTSEYRTSFEIPVDWADNYGTRMRGYFHPPQSATNYRFWIASDDASELWLSTDDSAANARKIAEVIGWTSPREWSKYTSQRSSYISLAAGQRYYIEARHKEGSGGDNLAVAWRRGTSGTTAVIGGQYLSPFGTDWERNEYDDSAWMQGSGGVGFERNPGDAVNFTSHIGIDVENAMYNKNGTCFIRIPFAVSDPDFAVLTLRMKYDDGFVAWLNGSEVARRNFIGAPEWNSSASALNADSAAVVFEDIDLSAHIGKLRTGNNMLAIQGLNNTVGSSDFLISAELVAYRSASGSTGGGVSPQAMSYTATGPFTLSRSCHIKARLRSGTTWGPLQEAVFGVGPVANNLRITELMYNPPTSSEAEFVELMNIGAESINLNLCRFTRGIDFTFGDLPLAPGARVIIVSSRSVFSQAYPDFAGVIAGEYTGRLDNSGERITLLDATGQTIHNFTYSDGWYDITDGGGFSLTIKDPTRIELDHVDGNLAGHYKLDEYGGASAADASGNGRNGVVRGDPKWHSYGGKINGAIELGGEGDYVEITNYKGVLGSGARTCTAWIKTTGQNVAIAGWGMVDPTGARWAMVVNAAGRLRQEFGGGYVLGTKVINDGKWHHVAVVLEGPRSDDVVLYVDGRREVISEMVSLSVNTQAGPNAAIGAHLGMNRYFNGLLDNVCIYERALSAEEVALLAAAADYWEDKQYWRPSAHVGGSPGEDDTGIVPEPGAVVINELLAHSHAAQPDWVELHNTTGEAINIGGWFLSDSKNDYMKFRIADNTILAPYGYAVFYESLHFNNTQNPGCL
ncbi:MAG: lamin tail domain-containing protein, partial [Phycisphaerae bacterium]|nr:lamin tail domain-containing protein [Phycisphaerae bacterium]